MARRRLTPPRPGFLDAADSGAEAPQPAPEVKSMFPMGVASTVTRAPIAQVAGEAAAQAALSDLAAEIARTRAEGRVIERLPLAEIDAGHLVRDRQSVDAEEMETLVSSIRARGQQMPVEVVDRGAGVHPRYGLISGWRRLMALGQIGESQVLALVRRPETAAEAYLAMVEENEIRAGISFYERARIVVKALESGVYPDTKTALNGLFGNVSRAKRSKIKSFMTLVETLDDALRFPAAISEKAGLALVQAIEAGHAPALREALQNNPAADAAAEAQLIARVCSPAPPPAAPEPPAPPRPADLSADRPDVRYDPETGVIVISGLGVGPALVQDLRRWLDKRGS